MHLMKTAAIALAFAVVSSASVARRWAGAVTSPAAAFVPGGSDPGRRTSAMTSCPRETSSAHVAPPTNPLALVTKTRTS